MSLDATAYEYVNLVEAISPGNERFDELLEGDLVYACPFIRAFEDHPNGLPEGVYETSGRSVGVSTTYSSYSMLRNAVSRAAAGKSASAVILSDEWRDVPFGWWINFADDEGILGPRTCRILADQAAEHELRLPTRSDRDRWGHWCEMFRVAADTGMISYR